MSSNRAIRIGHPMRTWQKECARLAAGKRFLVLVLHRRAGKTELALKKLVDAAIKNTLDLPMYFYVCPQLKQAKTVAWRRLKQMVEPLITNLVDIMESDLAVRFRHNGAVIRLYGADNPDAIRGSRLDGVVIDEVAQAKPEVWEEIIRPALADRRGWAWFLGTPKGIDLFSSLYFGASEWPEWGSARYTVYDTDALDPEEVARLRAEMGEQAFAREFLCDFTVSGDDQLISLVDVEEAAHRVYKVGEMDYAPVVLGIDPARFGNDRSVIYRRQRLQAFDPIVYRKMDNMTLAARIAEQIKQWNPDAVFIDAGNGSGVIDRLRQLGFDNIHEVHFGSTKTRNPRIYNVRTQIWCDLADWLRAGGAIPNRNTLKLELATPRYTYTASDQKILESKDDTKDRMPGHASPDEGDALALTFAMKVMKRNDPGAQQRTKDYDPYAVRN